MTLSHRAKRSVAGMLALASIEPLQIAFGLRRLRKKLDKSIETAEGEELRELAKAYVVVIDPLLRLCQVPTPPKGHSRPDGTNAKPVLDMQVVPDA